MKNNYFGIKLGKWSVVFVLIVLLLLGGFNYLSGSEPAKEGKTENVDRVTQVRTEKIDSLMSKLFRVPINGRVELTDQVILTHETGGEVRQVLVSMGDQVSQGQPLVYFDREEAEDQVRQAEANLDAASARLAEIKAGTREENIEMLRSVVRRAEISLADTKRETQKAIDQAREEFLNNDLQAYLADLSVRIPEYQNATPPMISGFYTEEEKGEYTVSVYRSQAQSGYSFSYVGPEGRGVGRVDTRTPQPLGKRGLYIQFPEDFARNLKVEWRIPIPNERGRGYASAKAAYLRALDNKESNIAQAKESLGQAEKELELALAGSREEQIMAQEAQVEQARVAVNTAKRRSGKLTVTAPFAGRVSSVGATAGELISPGQKLLKLVGVDGLKFKAYVGPGRARVISIGDRVEMVGGHHGVVTAVSPVLDPESGQVEIEVTLLEESGLISGEFTKGVILSELSEERLLVPLSAVSVTSAGESVFVVEGGRVERRSVTLGDVMGDRIEVIEGFEDIEAVIVDVSGIETGQKVEIKD